MIGIRETSLHRRRKKEDFLDQTMRGNRTEGDDRQRVIMVLPSSHRPSVEAAFSCSAVSRRSQ